MLSAEELLRALAAHPAASFHEAAVSGWITAFLTEQGLPFSRDPYGNLIARYSSGHGAPLIATVAHMDHPAFELIEGSPRPLAVLLGGVGRDCLPQGSPVRIFTDDDVLPGRIAAVRTEPETSRLLLELAVVGSARPGDWGVWEMEDFREDGNFLYMRAADDLAGCAVALATLCALREEGAEADVSAVFTRAEEVGLVGATLVAQQHLLPPETLVISLESSKVLPGVTQGAGPVIRVGDLRRTFDAGAEALLRAAAESIQSQDPQFRVQRHLMSGGTCEATAFGLYGYATTGIALALGNYHNQGDGRLAPEYIHRADLAGAAALLVHAVKGAKSADPLAGKERLDRLAAGYRARLRSTAPAPDALP